MEEEEEKYKPEPISMDTTDDFDTLVKKWLLNPPWRPSKKINE
jgi:hypothetical protein